MSARARIPVSDKKKKRFLRALLSSSFAYAPLPFHQPHLTIARLLPPTTTTTLTRLRQTNVVVGLLECRGAIGITDEQQGRMECAHTGSSSSISPFAGGTRSWNSLIGYIQHPQRRIYDSI